MRIDSFVPLFIVLYLSAVLVLLYKSSGLATAAREYLKSSVTEIQGQ